MTDWNGIVCMFFSAGKEIHFKQIEPIEIKQNQICCFFACASLGFGDCYDFSVRRTGEKDIIIFSFIWISYIYIFQLRDIYTESSSRWFAIDPLHIARLPHPTRLTSPHHFWRNLETSLWGTPVNPKIGTSYKLVMTPRVTLTLRKGIMWGGETWQQLGKLGHRLFIRPHIYPQVGCRKFM